MENGAAVKLGDKAGCIVRMAESLNGQADGVEVPLLPRRIHVIFTAFHG